MNYVKIPKEEQELLLELLKNHKDICFADKGPVNGTHKIFMIFSESNPRANVYIGIPLTKFKELSDLIQKTSFGTIFPDEYNQNKNRFGEDIETED